MASSSSSSSAPLWEASKENAAPLQRGRNVHALETSLQMDSPARRRQEKEKMVQHYEALVRPSEEESHQQEHDDDPLIHWLSYIKFHQDAFPSDTHAQFLLMERCTRALLHVQEYKHDVRFIRVCVTYADQTSSPAHVFKYLHQHSVGTETALFWMAWAWVAETRGDYDFAEKVFRKGIHKRAKPLDKLQQRHRQFQRRFAKHVLQQQQQQEEEEYSNDDDGQGGRGTLAGLTEERVRRNDRRVSTDENHVPASSRARRHRHGNNRSSSSSTTTSHATFIDRTVVDRRHDRPDLNKNNNHANAASGFEIFVDDSQDNDGGYNLDQSHVQQQQQDDDSHDDSHHRQRVLEREEERRKENTASAEPWNRRGGLLMGGSAEASVPLDPSFAVYMHETCAATQQRLERLERARHEQARHARDERTLQQRTEQDIAEKLARDPMRYVRNPSKLSTDQQQQGHVVASCQDTKSTLSCGFDKRLISKDSSGQECCFQEGRARAHSYRLMTDATKCFNLLATTTTKHDSTMSMETTTSDVETSFSSSRQRPMTLFDRDESVCSSFHANNLSTASSTVNESHAVGIPKEEETINTKLAMKELSMMFSSPAMGLGGSDAEGAILLEKEEGDTTATFSLVDGLVDDDAANNSILVAGEEHDENDGHARNPNARNVDNEYFHQVALQMLEGERDASVGGRATEQAAASGFSIYCDDDDDYEGDTTRAPFEIYQDPARESVGDTATFSVLASALQTSSPAASAPAGFEIFNDDDKRSSGGDTATFSLLGDVLKPAPPVASAAAFHIHEDETDCEGDTATFSVFGNAMTARNDGKAAAGFSMYADDGNKTDDFEMYQPPQAAGSPEFGDISRIVADEHDLTFRRAPISPRKQRESDEALLTKNVLNYSQVHKASVRAALRQLQVKVRQNAIRGVVRPRDSDLARVMSTEGYVDDFPKQSLPRELLQSSSSKGSMITLGNLRGLVKEELGKGSYGKVVLLESKEDPTVTAVAVKAQAPTDCLGLEYTILKAVQERVEPYCKGHFPFPRALSFVSVSDGALLGMTNASQSGINLVDLVNVYKAVEDTPVPELIALHYTILMLKIIEALHWHGKILHCDAKPDNWVLSNSNSAFEGCTEEIPGSGLMLVDFGRAVDLTTAAKSGTDPMNVVLRGSASDQQMECVAMRKGLGWSFDADTFGICAGAHALLYGTHIEIDFNSSTRRWMPRKPLRRYWKKDLWTDFFDTLLNLDKVSHTALGSRPGSLRDLRKRMESHLQTRSSELESLLRHQGRILPPQRIT